MLFEDPRQLKFAALADERHSSKLGKMWSRHNECASMTSIEHLDDKAIAGGFITDVFNAL